MKQRSKTLVVQISWSGSSRFGSVKADYGMPSKNPLLNGDNGGETLAGKFFSELVTVLPDLPSIKMIKLNAWLGLYNAFADNWKPSLQEFLDLGLGIPLRLGFAES
jgi:hypothetical protein